MTEDFDVPDPADLADSYEERDTMTVTVVQIHLADNHDFGPYSLNSARDELYALKSSNGGLDYDRIQIQGLATQLQTKPIRMLRFKQPMADPAVADWEQEEEAPEGTISVMADAITCIEEYQVEVEVEDV